jgi:hypothetical protein
MRIYLDKIDFREMHNLSIHKTLLFNLLKKNKFVNSKFFVENCHPEINELIQKEIKRNLKCPLSIKNSQILYNEFTYLKTKWKSLNGGRSKSKFILDLCNKKLDFIFVESDFEESSTSQNQGLIEDFFKEDNKNSTSSNEIQDKTNEKIFEHDYLCRKKFNSSQKKRVKNKMRSKLKVTNEYLKGIGMMIESIRIVPFLESKNNAKIIMADNN